MIAYFVRCFALAALASSLCLSTSAEDEVWETQLDEPGLLVQTRAVEGSKFKAFRATARIAATPEQVLGRLHDVASYPGWFPNTIEARRLSMAGGDWANYVRTDAPWPVKDRDAVYTQSLQRDGPHIRIDVGVDPTAVPEVEGAVRVQQAGGYWELVAVPAAQGDGALTETAVVWEFHLELGGNVPSGIANTRIAQTPEGALRALQVYFVESGPAEKRQ